MSENTRYLDDSIVVLGHEYKIRFYPEHVRGRVLLSVGWSRDGKSFTMVAGQDSGDGAKDRLRSRVAAVVHRAHHDLRAQTPPAAIIVYGHDQFGAEMVIAELNAHHSELFDAAPTGALSSMLSSGESGSVNRAALRELCSSPTVAVLHCPVTSVTALVAACRELRIGTLLIEVERPLTAQFEDVLRAYRDAQADALQEYGLKLLAVVQPVLSGCDYHAGVTADIKVVGIHQVDTDAVISRAITWCKLQSLKRVLD